MAFWAPPETHVVTYSGSVAARNILQENELWLQPSSLDGKVGSSGSSSTVGRGALPNRVPKPDVVLTTYEVICSDMHVLSDVPWSSVIIDRRQRSRSASGKAQAALQELVGRHKIVLSSHGVRAGLEQLFRLLTFVKPGDYEEIADVVPAGVTEPEQQVMRVLLCNIPCEHPCISLSCIACCSAVWSCTTRMQWFVLARHAGRTDLTLAAASPLICRLPR